jgi:hypothetical protein
MKIYSSFYRDLLAFIAQCRSMWPMSRLDVYVTQPVFVQIGKSFHGHDVHVHSSGHVMGVLIEGPREPGQFIRELGSSKPAAEIKGRRTGQYRELVNEPSALEEMEEACAGK